MKMWGPAWSLLQRSLLSTASFSSQYSTSNVIKMILSTSLKQQSRFENSGFHGAPWSLHLPSSMCTETLNTRGSYYSNAPEGAPIENNFERRLTGRYEVALGTALLGDMVIREKLVTSLGFTIHGVRISKDRRRLSILWDCYPGRADQCEVALKAVTPRMSDLVQSNLKCRFRPFIQFTHDSLPHIKQLLAQTYEKLDVEEISKESSSTGAGGAAPRNPTLSAAERFLQSLCKPKHESERPASQRRAGRSRYSS
jgi:ribosome-binding factor A